MIEAKVVEGFDQNVAFVAGIPFNKKTWVSVTNPEYEEMVKSSPFLVYRPVVKEVKTDAETEVKTEVKTDGKEEATDVKEGENKKAAGSK